MLVIHSHYVIYLLYPFFVFKPETPNHVLYYLYETLNIVIIVIGGSVSA